MQTRNLSEADVVAALKTYTPTGRPDEYLGFASGGHGGNLIVFGVPSMRLLKYIGVFTPEPWQGYVYGDRATEQMFAGGDRFGKKMTWGDMHHPALSETNGEYDGEYVFVGDKANARVAVVSLKDFATRQIVTTTLIQSDHGAAFVTPNTEYVVETSQYPAPLGGGYAPIEKYDELYRGAAIFWKFDREKGLLDPAASFAIELPPYMQDLADCGKLASDGWVFINSFNSERSYGGILEGKPALESGASQNDMDYLHCIRWRKAEELVAAGRTKEIAGMRVLPLEVAAAEGVLFFVPEPKSPHGVDVTPDGKDIVVGGKLDTHTTVYSIEKINALIEAENFAGKDPYGVPILDFAAAIRGQCEIGLGPLHTVFDADGFAYTSVFIESVIAKWSLADLKVVHKLPMHYNIGHL
ncbi:MAG TPA: cytochrome C, partial [Planctomycetota bacterium]|nr:cytochrome C [Planctomycetota bacterium]